MDKDVDAKAVQPLICTQDQQDRLPSGALLYEINLLNLKECKICVKTEGAYVCNGGSAQAICFTFISYACRFVGFDWFELMFKLLVWVSQCYLVGCFLKP